MEITRPEVSFSDERGEITDLIENETINAGNIYQDNMNIAITP